MDGLILCHGLVSSDTNKLYAVTGNIYWIASPCGTGTNNMMLINGAGGAISNSYAGTNGGFRPLICLNSNVKLERQENGTYIIK